VLEAGVSDYDVCAIHKVLFEMLSDIRIPAYLLQETFDTYVAILVSAVRNHVM
jgi:hypothetical protein